MEVEGAEPKLLGANNAASNPAPAEAEKPAASAPSCHKQELPFIEKYRPQKLSDMVSHKEVQY